MLLASGLAFRSPLFAANGVRPFVREDKIGPVPTIAEDAAERERLDDGRLTEITHTLRIKPLVVARE